MEVEDSSLVVDRKWCLVPGNQVELGAAWRGLSPLVMAAGNFSLDKCKI